MANIPPTAPGPVLTKTGGMVGGGIVGGVGVVETVKLVIQAFDVAVRLLAPLTVAVIL